MWNEVEVIVGSTQEFPSPECVTLHGRLAFFNSFTSCPTYDHETYKSPIVAHSRNRELEVLMSPIVVQQRITTGQEEIASRK